MLDKFIHVLRCLVCHFYLLYLIEVCIQINVCTSIETQFFYSWAIRLIRYIA